MLIYKSDNVMTFKNINSKSKDYLYVISEMGGQKLIFIVVYFSVNDKTRNDAMKKEIEGIVESNEGRRLVILGDFNGHVGFKGYQQIDENGKMIIEWMEKYNLIMLNDDFNCRGEVTWRRHDQESVIDFVLVSKECYDVYEDMEIDEQQTKFDLTDHNLIEVRLRREGQRRNNTKNQWLTREYYKTDEDTLSKFKKNVEEHLEGKIITNIEELNKILRDKAEETLRVKYKRKLIQVGEKEKEEAPWVTEEIRKGISNRKLYNRLRRNARTEEDKHRYENQYQEEKTKVHMMIREAIYKQEDKETREIKSSKNNKKMWEHIDKLRKKCRREKTLQVYDEQGNCLSKEEGSRNLEDFWPKKNIKCSRTRLRKYGMKK